MKLKNILIIPLAISLCLCGFFAYKWSTSSKNITIEMNSEQEINILQTLDLIPAKEITVTYDKEILKVDAIMQKTDIQTMLSENGMLNFMTSAMLLIIPDEVLVSLDIKADENDSSALIIERIGIEDYSLDVSIRIN